jgi:hypothetical protein
MGEPAQGPRYRALTYQRTAGRRTVSTFPLAGREPAVPPIGGHGWCASCEPRCDIFPWAAIGHPDIREMKIQPRKAGTSRPHRRRTLTHGWDVTAATHRRMICAGGAPSGSAPRPPGRTCAPLPPSRHPPARPSVTGSTPAATCRRSPGSSRPPGPRSPAMSTSWLQPQSCSTPSTASAPR